MDQLGGNSVEIAFAGLNDKTVTVPASYVADYLIETATHQKPSDIKEIRGENNEIYTKLRSNKAETFNFELIVPNGVTITKMYPGDRVNIRRPGYLDVPSIPDIYMMVVSYTVSYQREETKISLAVIKEAGISYDPPP